MNFNQKKTIAFKVAFPIIIFILLGLAIAWLWVGDSMRARLNAKAKTFEIHAKPLTVSDSDLILIGFHTKLIGLEDPRCGLLNGHFSSRDEFYLSNEKISTLEKGAWLYTVGIKPVSVMVTGDLLEIAIDSNFTPDQGKNQIFIFCINESASEISDIYIK